MRSLKFRVWDKDHKCWSNAEVFIGDGYLGLEERYDWALVQQFTGFYDRDNKEVYEGDILEGDGTLDSEFIRSSIEFKYGKFIDSKYGYNLDFLAENSFKEYKLKRYKVIGNILENKDLIEL